MNTQPKISQATKAIIAAMLAAFLSTIALGTLSVIGYFVGFYTDALTGFMTLAITGTFCFTPLIGAAFGIVYHVASKKPEEESDRQPAIRERR